MSEAIGVIALWVLSIIVALVVAGESGHERGAMLTRALLWPLWLLLTLIREVRKM